MEQQLSSASASSNASSAWGMGEDTDKLCTLQLAVREKDRVISRLECQVEEQVRTKKKSTHYVLSPFFILF
jgi:hypothetical protein